MHRSFRVSDSEESKGILKSLKLKEDPVEDEHMREMVVKFRDSRRWHDAELSRLHDNFNDFIKMHKIKDIESFLFRHGRLYKQSLGYYEHIIAGLSNRTKRSANRRLKQELMTKKRGRLSEVDIEELLLWKKDCRNLSWTEIGLIMGRGKDVLLTKYKYSNISRKADETKDKSNSRSGRWDLQELQRFNEALAAESLKNGKNENRKRWSSTKINWNVVSKTVGSRSVLQCMKRYQSASFAVGKFRGRYKLGKWDDQEVERLKYAATCHEHQAHLFKALNSDNISNYVKTRCPVQCYSKFKHLSELKQKETSKQLLLRCSFKKEKLYGWSQSCDTKLISILKQEDDESSVDWFDICDQFHNNYPIKFLKHRWHLLKTSTENYQILSFQEVVNSSCQTYDTSN